MLIKDGKHWFTANAYNFSRCSPNGKSLFDIDKDMQRRRIIKKHFTIKIDNDSTCCFLYYHDRYISAWSKWNSLEASWVIEAAVNTYIVMGGKLCR